MSFGLKKIIERERVPYPGKEKLFIVLGLLLTDRISTGKAAELFNLRVDELWLLLRKLGIEYDLLDEEEAEEVNAYRKVLKGSA